MIEKASKWITSNLIAMLALIVSIVGLPFFDTLFPSNDTKINIFEKQAYIEEGRLGKGPQIIIGINFSNLGNRSTTISDAHINYALGSSDAKEVECGSEEFTWMGVPWQKFVKENASVRAVPIQILAGMPHSEIIVFEPANVLSDLEISRRKEHRIFACLSLEYINSSMDSYSKRIPLGVLNFTVDRMLSFNWNNEVNDVISLY